jgi:hypothetical protein
MVHDRFHSFVRDDMLAKHLLESGAEVWHRPPGALLPRARKERSDRLAAQRNGHLLASLKPGEDARKVLSQVTNRCRLHVKQYVSQISKRQMDFSTVQPE